MRLRWIVLTTASLAVVALAGCSKKSTAPAPDVTITGTVRHLDGSLYPHALVDAQTLMPFDGMLEITTVESDTMGTFAFSGLRNTGYTVSVVEDDSLAVADTVQAPSSGVDLRLRPGTVFRGVALKPDTTDKSGVLVITDLPTAFTFTDTLGFFDLRGVAPGAREVVAIDLLAGTSAGVFVTALPGDTIRLDTLRLHAGTPSPAWRARLAHWRAVAATRRR
jgi:hypothetical protein